tara:strand:+ start:297 stop:464 length:168 start_codon:yes stop_codon:yes gene_type:complete
VARGGGARAGLGAPRVLLRRVGARFCVGAPPAELHGARTELAQARLDVLTHLHAS